MSTVVQGVAFLRATFTGRNGAGSISIPGLQAGDFVLKAQRVYGVSSDDYSGGFEKTITVDDEIQQNTPADLSAVTDIYAITLRGI
jgi:hypothetical protein